MKLPAGIRLIDGHYRAFVRVGGKLYSKRFPSDTALAIMRHWREAERVRVREGRAADAKARTFQQDCDEYLSLIEHMPTFADRRYRIEQWAAAFPARTRASITALDIRQQLERWRAKGSAAGGPLSAGSLNLRRTALMALYTTLDGKGQPNPVKAVPPYREIEQPLTLPTHDEARRAIEAVRNKTHGAHVRPSVTQLRLWVLYWTGWPASTLMRVRAQDIDRARQAVVLHARLKGGGTVPRESPVLPEALIALDALAKAGGLGAFSTSSLHGSLRYGCQKAGVRPFRPYALRHLFLTTLAKNSRDERGISELGGHMDPRQTRRYTRHAASDRARAVLAETGDAFRSPTPTKSK